MHSGCVRCPPVRTTDNEPSPSPPSRVQMVSVSFHLRKYITNLMISINWLLVDALKNQEIKNRIIDDVLRRIYVYDLVPTLRAQTHGLGQPNVYALWNEVNSDDSTISTTLWHSSTRKHCTKQNFVIKTHERNEKTKNYTLFAAWERDTFKSFIFHLNQWEYRLPPHESSVRVKCARVAWMGTLFLTE